MTSQNKLPEIKSVPYNKPPGITPLLYRRHILVEPQKNLMHAEKLERQADRGFATRATLHFFVEFMICVRLLCQTFLFSKV
jgi:hypothetical protein